MERDVGLRCCRNSCKWHEHSRENFEVVRYFSSCWYFMTQRIGYLGMGESARGIWQKERRVEFHAAFWLLQGIPNSFVDIGSEISIDARFRLVALLTTSTARWKNTCRERHTFKMIRYLRQPMVSLAQMCPNELRLYAMIVQESLRRRMMCIKLYEKRFHSWEPSQSLRASHQSHPRM